MRQDLWYAARVLRKSPGFAALAIISLALGTGANTAIFQLLDAVRLRSLPVSRPQELVEVRIAGGNHGMGVNPGRYGGLTRPIWDEIRRHHEPFSDVFAWRTQDRFVGAGSELIRVKGIDVSGEFFRALGLQPWRGRPILPEDAEITCPAPNAVVSYGYWQAALGGRDLAVAPISLRIDDVPRQVVGVTPPEFFGLAVGEHFDVALPLCRPIEVRRDVFDLSMMGRLATGWTIDRASAALNAASPGIFAATAPTGYSARTVDTYKQFRLGAYPASGGVSWLRSTYTASLSLLLVVTGLVLLIACANLANLMLARASTRQREVAVRMALGASGGRLLRQLLTESGLLAAIGAIAGIALAQLLSRALVRSLSTEGSRINLRMAIDWRVLLFVAAVAAATCAFFGAVPALRATSTDPAAAMKEGARGLSGGRERFSVQRLLIVAQISISLVLLVGALLFVQSFRNLMTFNPGMREDGITVAFLGFQRMHLARDHYQEFQQELLDEVRTVPGIVSAATTTQVPLLGGSWGHGIRIGSMEGSSRFTWVSPDYFQTMGITLLTGRDFMKSDTAASPRVAVVNERFIQQFLGRTNPIGQTLRTSPEPNYPATVYEIVGVIADTKYDDIRRETPPMAFAPASQFPAPGPFVGIMIHSPVAPPLVIAAVKQKIAMTHPEIIMQFAVFRNEVRDGMVRERLMAMLSGFFGLLAALLTVVGLYGVISYVVARRRSEIGIRLALGASRTQVVGMVMREAAWLVIAGVMIGVVLSIIAGRGATSLLFGLKASDPLTLGAACALLSMIAALASFLPARGASRVDPAVVLRCE